MNIDNKLGREQPSRLEFENSGFVFCDGIVIDNVRNMNIDYCDDEIILQDKNNYEVGIIHGINKRELCIFGESINHLEYKDHYIIINGEVVI